MKLDCSARGSPEPNPISTMAPMSRPAPVLRPPSRLPSRPNWDLGMDPVFMDVGEKTRPVPYRDTSNEAYGKYYYGWDRSFLPTLPSIVKNKELENFLQKLETSNDAYGHFLRPERSSSRSTPVRGVPHYYPLKEFEERGVQTGSRPGTAGGARTPVCSAGRRLSRRVSASVGIVPCLEEVIDEKISQLREELRETLLAGRREEYPAGDRGKPPGSAGLKFPNIKTIDLNLHMNDDSMVTVRSIPFSPAPPATAE